MKTLNLNEYGVCVIDRQEAKETNGGAIWWPVLTFLGGLAYDLISNYSDTADHFMMGWKVGQALDS